MRFVISCLDSKCSQLFALFVCVHVSSSACMCECVCVRVRRMFAYVLRRICECAVGLGVV